MFQTIERYEHFGLGLPYPIVILGGAEEELDEAGNRVGIHIPNSDGLAASVALARALLPVELSGSEVRFIRRAIGMTARELAAAADIKPETLSRWENDKCSMGQWADKQIRLMAVVALRGRVPGVTADDKSVVALNPVRRVVGVWPKLEMRLVHIPSEQGGNSEDEAWDFIPQLLAA